MFISEFCFGFPDWNYSCLQFTTTGRLCRQVFSLHSFLLLLEHKVYLMGLYCKKFVTKGIPQPVAFTVFNKIWFLNLQLIHLVCKLVRQQHTTVIPRTIHPRLLDQTQHKTGHHLQGTEI